MTFTDSRVAQSEPIHPPDTLDKYLPKDKHLGPVDLSGIEIVAKEETQEEKDRKERAANKPDMSECLSLYDFEVSGFFRRCPCENHETKGEIARHHPISSTVADVRTSSDNRLSPNRSYPLELGLTVILEFRSISNRAGFSN